MKSTESFRESIFEKKYMKIFVLAIFLLIVGIILISVRNLYSTYADPDSPKELEVFFKTRDTLSILSELFLPLGMVLFSLSAFWGGVVDKTLSEEVRRGLVFAASLAIIALAIVMVFQGIFII